MDEPPKKSPPKGPPLPSFSQNLLDGRGPYSYLSTHETKYLIISETKLTQFKISGFLERNPGPLGFSAGYNVQTKRINAITFVGPEFCLVVEFPSSKEESEGKVLSVQRQHLQRVCEHPAGLFAFDMAPLALGIYSELGLVIHCGVDIQSAKFEAPESRNGQTKRPDNRLDPLAAIKACLGNDAVKVFESNVASAFRDMTYDGSLPLTFDLTKRAWIAHFLATFQNGPQTFAEDRVPRIDLSRIPDTVRDFLAKVSVDASRRNYIKPMETVHEFSDAFLDGDALHARSEVYKDKMRSGKVVKLGVENEYGGQYNVMSTTGSVSGRDATIAKGSLSLSTRVTSITSVGRDGPTRAEQHRAELVLRFVQGKIKEHAVEHMLSSSNEHRIVLIQGPPGTGKTSVIAKYVTTVVEAGGPANIWLIAKSNVAVKNIAEKLVSINFTKWRLLVSDEFHLGWHEHLYQGVVANVIRSKQFAKVGQEELSDCKVILCTLGMLSNKQLSKFTRPVPIERLVVDEASQIEIGDYLPAFDVAAGTLRKLCLIGDDKQLPPHGQEDLKNLRSIFEVDHLRGYIDFLDTQYRMPPQIGKFISDHVYDGQLKSNPAHPITDEVLACRLVDAEGQEMKSNSRGPGSWFENHAEARVVISIASQLQSQKKTFRIITPYDGQRNRIEKWMKDGGMAWENTCFNVDSFQGNEADFIIISLVRSRSIGFLNNLRRTNVMLSRCKKGMIIVTSRAFLSGVGINTLVGKMKNTLEAEHGQKLWLSHEEIESGRLWGESSRHVYPVMDNFVQ